MAEADEATTGAGEEAAAEGEAATGAADEEDEGATGAGVNAATVEVVEATAVEAVFVRRPP